MPALPLKLFRAAALCSALLVLGACSVNPVTGKKELAWMSEAWEVKTGRQYYSGQQQAGGGYYSLDPELTRYVKKVGDKVAQHAARKHLPYDFVVLNDSTPNAWALPGGKIAVNRGLLAELNNEAELAAVLAHEVVHADARHSAQSQEVGTLIAGGQMLATVMVANSDSNSAALQQGVALGALYGQTRYSRSRELEADKYGMEYMRAAGYDPIAAVSLQETFVRLSQGRSQDLFSTLFASHPPSMARVEANRRTAAELPAGGVLGEQSFANATSALRKRQPAYDVATKAGEAMANKDYQTALSMVERAIDMEPREGRFHELRGIALSRMNRVQDAMSAYNRAVSLDPNYFSPLLRRGLLKHQLNSFSEAERDLKASIKLAPTEVAFVKLGAISEQRGNICPQAFNYYREAFVAGGQRNAELQNKLV
ncbi:MAG: M48 family metalloprotease, partial [Pseudomonadales bacterium]|nr:M48 family metalloprotease [Pseudomonadales bacterium]